MSNVNFVSSIPGLVVGVTYADTSTSMRNQGSEMTGVFIGKSQEEVEALIVEHANVIYRWIVWLEEPKPIPPESTSIDGT